MNRLLTGGVVIALALSGLAFFGVNDGVDGRDGRVGAQSGPDHYDLQVFNAGLVSGGNHFATSSSGAGTLVAGNLFNSQGYVRYMTIDATDAVTVTFPATSTLTSYIPATGDCADIVIENSGDSNLTLAGGTGMDIQEPDGQNVVIGTTNYALITLCRQLNRDILLVVDETIPG